MLISRGLGAYGEDELIMRACWTGAGVGSRREQVRVIANTEPSENIGGTVCEWASPCGIPFLEKLRRIGSIVANVVESIVGSEIANKVGYFLNRFGSGSDVSDD